MLKTQYGEARERSEPEGKPAADLLRPFSQMRRVKLQRHESITSRIHNTISQRGGFVKQFQRRAGRDFSVAPRGSEAYYAPVRVSDSVDCVTPMEDEA